MSAAVALAERPAPLYAAEQPVIEVEPWSFVRAHIAPLWRRHYDEIADKRIHLDPDWTWYDAMARADRSEATTLATNAAANTTGIINRGERIRRIGPPLKRAILPPIGFRFGLQEKTLAKRSC